MDIVIEFFQTKGILFVQVLVVIIIGIILIKLFNKLLKKLLLKSFFDNSIASFTISLISLALYIGLIYLVFTMLGISTAGFIAALSAIVLAISLALQNTLSNLASGFIIVLTKPFKQGDFIQVGEVSGRIKSIHFFNTHVITVENKVVILPNNQIINNNLINYTKRKTRRVEVIVPVAYGCDIDKVKKVIENAVIKNKRAVLELGRTVRLFRYGASSLDFVVWCWCNADEYFDTLFDLNEDIYKALDKNQISIPFNQMDVHIIPEKPVVKEIKNEDTLNVIDANLATNTVSNNIVNLNIEKKEQLTKPVELNIATEKPLKTSKVINKDELVIDKKINIKKDKLVKPTEINLPTETKEEKPVVKQETKVTEKVTVKKEKVVKPVVNASTEKVEEKPVVKQETKVTEKVAIKKEKVVKPAVNASTEKVEEKPVVVKQETKVSEKAAPKKTVKPAVTITIEDKKTVDAPLKEVKTTKTNNNPKPVKPTTNKTERSTKK